MNEHFSSAHLTLERAHFHISDLEGQINEFRHNNSWAYFVETDPETGDQIHKIRFTHKVLVRWSCVLFDAVNNLRAVLDQTAYAVAVITESPSTKHVAFPFAKDKAHWAAKVAGCCKDLPPEIVSLFEASNAYKGGNDTLWAMNELCNTKKHFKLVPMSMQGLAITTSPPLGDSTSERPFWDAENLQLIFLRVPAGQNVNHNVHVAYNISVEGIDVLAAKTVSGFIHNAHKIVEGILVTTEAECRRLGFIS
ncbi:MAG: hypothetical protein V3S07_08525 [Micropepsaceae bacterium]